MRFAILVVSGGGGGIRTLAALTNTNGLANRPLQPLGYSSGMIHTKLYPTIPDCNRPDPCDTRIHVMQYAGMGILTYTKQYEIGFNCFK